jgi:D-inositol-3-phosphate glycosyltransferase
VTIRVYQIEPIGGHRGMHYYDLQLGDALAAQGIDLHLMTSDETIVDSPRAYPVNLVFRGIFGTQSMLLRGLRYLRALLTIALTARKGDQAIIHLHFALVPLLDWIFVKVMKLRGFHVVVTAHDVVPFDRGISASMRKMLRLADHLIVHALPNKDELLRAYGIPSSRVAVIPHGNYMGHLGAMIPQGEAKTQLGIEPNRQVVLFFGQIKRVKGLQYLLEAVSILRDQGLDIMLVVAGTIWKDDWSRYDQLIDELDIRDLIRTRIEHIPDQDVATYFSAADVVALPYMRIYQSGVLLMALSYGRPVVATSTGGMAQVVRDSESGLLVPPGDPEALAAAIREVVSDKEQARRMGEAGKRIADKEYAWDDIARKTIIVYKKALGLNPGQPSDPATDSN